jgi:alkylation response protein AidB-like acyl-CoA dehydrogenase
MAADAMGVLSEPNAVTKGVNEALLVVSDAKLLRIHEGTSQIQRMVIVRHVLAES